MKTSDVRDSSPGAAFIRQAGHSCDRAAWLNGGAAHCSLPPVPPQTLCRLVLLGAPGVGKGTQASLLRQDSGACHLSTGEIFRAAKKFPASERSPAMESACQYMARGELVPDQTVLEVICERVSCLRCAGGFLLDGFPRTVAQAEALEQLLKTENLALTAVVDYELHIDEIVSRLAGRRVCLRCKGVSQATTRCPHCGGEVHQREDDHPEAIRVRMEAYHGKTAPLVDFYRRRELLLTIPATGSPDEILLRTRRALDCARMMD